MPRLASDTLTSDVARVDERLTVDDDAWDAFAAPERQRSRAGRPVRDPPVNRLRQYALRDARQGIRLSRDP
jgi:hypothetical protein